jgi:hypothetical protein
MVAAGAAPPSERRINVATATMENLRISGTSTAANRSDKRPDKSYLSFYLPSPNPRLVFLYKSAKYRSSIQGAERQCGSPPSSEAASLDKRSPSGGNRLANECRIVTAIRQPEKRVFKKTNRFLRDTEHVAGLLCGASKCDDSAHQADFVPPLRKETAANQPAG